MAIITFVVIFVATVIEKHFIMIAKVIPKNPLTAFIYAALLPVCSCTVVPIIKILDKKVNVRTRITFLVAAPILNPYIIFLSFSILGWKYGILRIVCSFLLSVSAGFFMQFLSKYKMTYSDKAAVDHAIRLSFMEETKVGACISKCNNVTDNVFAKSFNMFRSICLYIMIAGIISIGFELTGPTTIELATKFGNTVLGSIILVLSGIPIYLCNGTDVLILRPLLYTGISLGTAIAFSITSTSVCLSSIALLSKFLGLKYTIILTTYITAFSIIIGLIINFISC
jgi:uncharacterized membrane protein YraQ (UPF0718 family)